MRENAPWERSDQIQWNIHHWRATQAGPSIGRSTFTLLNWVPPKTWLTANPVRCSDLSPSKTKNGVPGELYHFNSGNRKGLRQVLCRSWLFHLEIVKGNSYHSSTSARRCISEMVDAGGPVSVRKCPGAALTDLGDVKGFDRSGWFMVGSSTWKSRLYTSWLERSINSKGGK